MCNIGRVQNTTVDSSTLKPPTMSQLVGETVHSRRVKCIDVGGNAAIAFVGVALIAFAVAMMIITSHTYGWTAQMSPIYAILGIAGFSGTILSMLAIKRMVDHCRKRDQFQEDVREVI